MREPKEVKIPLRLLRQAAADNKALEKYLPKEEAKPLEPIALKDSQIKKIELWATRDGGCLIRRSANGKKLTVIPTSLFKAKLSYSLNAKENQQKAAAGLRQSRSKTTEGTTTEAAQAAAEEPVATTPEPSIA